AGRVVDAGGLVAGDRGGAGEAGPALLEERPPEETGAPPAVAARPPGAAVTAPGPVAVEAAVGPGGLGPALDAEGTAVALIGCHGAGGGANEGLVAGEGAVRDGQGGGGAQAVALRGDGAAEAAAEGVAQGLVAVEGT